MTKFPRVLLPAIAFCVAFALPSPAPAAPRLEVRLGAERIWLGDAFAAQVVLHDAPGGDVSPPVFANTENAAFAGGAPQRNSSSRITIVNGQRRVEENHTVVWTYQITPRDSGVFALGGVSTETASGTLSAQIPSVTVLGPDPQPYIAVAVSGPRHEVVLDEEFSVTVEITALRLEGRFAHQDPFPGGNYQPGILELPFLDDGETPNLVLASPVKNILSPLLQRREGAGFRINNLELNPPSSGMFGMPSMFQNPQPDLFFPARTEAEAGGEPVFKYTFEIPFRAVSPGAAPFPAARFKGDVIVPNADGSGFVAQRVFAVSDPFALRVVPPPTEGRPNSFFGSLATRLEAVAALDTQTCFEGDPLVLTLGLRGDFTTANMRVPDIALARGFAETFRQYGDTETENTAGGGRRFKYRIRPVVSGTIELPAIPVSYFDTGDRTYKTVWSAPVPLRVNPAPEFAGFFGGDTEMMFLPAKQQNVSGLVTGKFFNNETKGPIEKKSTSLFSIISLFKLFAIPPFLYLLVVAGCGLWRGRGKIAGMLKRKTSPARALRMIRNAEIPEEVLKGVEILTTGGTDAKQQQAGKPVVHGELKQLLQEVSNASFDPTADAGKVVRERRGRIAELLSGTKFVLFAALVFGGAVMADEFVLRRVNAAAAVAHTPAEFAAAAAMLRPLVEADKYDAALLYNYGTLLLLAEENGAALDVLLRAEALAGAVPEIANNIAVAYGDSAPWVRAPLFWHYGTGLGQRVNALFAVWCALWTGLLARRRKWGKMMLVAGIVAAIVLASSVAASKRLLEKELARVERMGVWNEKH